MSSFPVPVSPRMSTLESVCATRSTSVKKFRMVGDTVNAPWKFVMSRSGRRCIVMCDVSVLEQLRIEDGLSGDFPSSFVVMDGEDLYPIFGQGDGMFKLCGS